MRAPSELVSAWLIKSEINSPSHSKWLENKSWKSWICCKLIFCILDFFFFSHTISPQKLKNVLKNNTGPFAHTRHMKGMKVTVIYVLQNASVSQWSCFQKVEDTEIHLKWKQFQSWIRCLQAIFLCFFVFKCFVQQHSGYPKQIMKFHGCFFFFFLTKTMIFYFKALCLLGEEIN